MTPAEDKKQTFFYFCYKLSQFSIWYEFFSMNIWKLEAEAASSKSFWPAGIVTRHKIFRIKIKANHLFSLFSLTLSQRNKFGVLTWERILQFCSIRKKVGMITSKTKTCLLLWLCFRIDRVELDGVLWPNAIQRCNSCSGYGFISRSFSE